MKNAPRLSWAKRCAALAEFKIRPTTRPRGHQPGCRRVASTDSTPAPEAELAELVRHQAAREFTASGDGAALDFVLAPQDSPTARVVTAAALSEQQLANTQEVCRGAQIKPRRFLLHPYSACSLLVRGKTEKVVLLVDSGQDETDLTVLVDGRVFLCRTVRNHQRSTEANGAELKPRMREFHSSPRSAGRQSPCETRRVEVRSKRSTFVATKRRAASSCARLQEELSIPVELFDPWAKVTRGGSLEAALPPHPERFAALLGMLADEAEESQTGFDFLNPRRKPEPANRRRLIAVGAGAAALVVLTGVYFAWEQFAEIGGQIERLQQRSKDLDQLVKRGADKQASVAAIEDWSLGDVVWLDELRDLSLRFPQPRDAVLLRMTLSARPTGGGAVEMEGLVRDPSIVGRMESQLRDEYHEINTRRVQESVQGKTNTWKFDSSLSVSRRSKDDYLAYQPVTPSRQPAAPPRPAKRVKRPARPPPTSEALADGNAKARKSAGWVGRFAGLGLCRQLAISASTARSAECALRESDAAQERNRPQRKAAPTRAASWQEAHRLATSIVTA